MHPCGGRGRGHAAGGGTRLAAGSNGSTAVADLVGGQGGPLTTLWATRRSRRNEASFNFSWCKLQRRAVPVCELTADEWLVAWRVCVCVS